MPFTNIRHRWDSTRLVNFRRPEEASSTPPVECEKYGLFELTSSSVEEQGIDIVAVHGLGGHYLNTWTSENGRCWLRDFLPLDLPSARVMSYGYNSSTAFSSAVTDIEDEARMLLNRLYDKWFPLRESKRPIVFVAHSLGGIVVKKALILAHERSTRYGELLSNVRAAVFFGVPHRGSDVAYWGTLAADIVRLSQFGLNTNKNFVRDLRRNAPVLASISTQFVERGAKLDQIRNFFETQKLYGHLIVDKHSACLNLSNEVQDGIAGADHRSICRFDSEGSSSYAPVRNAMVELGHLVLSQNSTSGSAVAVSSVARNASQLNRHVSGGGPRSLDIIMSTPASASSTDQSKPLDALFYAPVAFSDKQFVGRADVLEVLNTKLKSHQRVVLHGLGGVGKSQIAMRFCLQHRAMKPGDHILWVHCGSFARFEEDCKAIAKKASIPGHDNENADTPSSVADWLFKDTERRWLLVLDDADQLDVFFPEHVDATGVATSRPRGIADYLPGYDCSHGRILVTTRYKRLGLNLTLQDEAACIDVAPMTSEDARQLLQINLPSMREDGKENLDKVLMELDYLPLAIMHAVAYMKGNEMSFHVYLKELHDKDEGMQEILEYDEYIDAGRGTRNERSVLLTWSLSFEAIARKDAYAAKLMSLVAMMERVSIPFELLLCDGTVPRSRVRSALGILRSFDLIRYIDDDSFTLHRLVQLSIKMWLAKQGKLAETEDLSLNLLQGAFPDSISPSQWPTCNSYYLHVKAVTDSILKSTGIHNDGSAKKLLQCATLCQRMGEYDWQRGMYDASYATFEKAQEIRTHFLGRDHIDTVDSTLGITAVLAAKDQHEKLDEKLALILRKRESDLGHYHQGTLEAMRQLADVYCRQRKYEQAEPIEREWLHRLETLYGKDHESTWLPKRNLANTFHDQGKRKEAMAYFREIMEAQKVVLGPTHYETMFTAIGLASCLILVERATEAEELIRPIYKRLKSEYGTTSGARLSMLTLVRALAVGEPERQAEGVELARECLALHLRLVGERHDDTMWIMKVLAQILRTQGRLDEVTEIEEQCLRMCRKLHGDENAEALGLAERLATSYEILERFEDAIKHLLYMRDCLERIKGVDHPVSRRIRRSLLRNERYSKSQESADYEEFGLQDVPWKPEEDEGD